MTAQEWLAAFAGAMDLPAPSDDQIEQLLALAAEAAHSSERTAAPVACWLAARASQSPSAALEIAKRLTDDSAG